MKGWVIIFSNKTTLLLNCSFLLVKIREEKVGTGREDMMGIYNKDEYYNKTIGERDVIN